MDGTSQRRFAVGITLALAFFWSVDFAEAQDEEYLAYFVTCTFEDAIIAIDPRDGSRKVVSGPLMDSPNWIAIEPRTGNFVITDSEAVYRYNVSNYKIGMLSGPGFGSGTAFGYPEAIAVLPSGQIVVVDPFNNLLMQVHPVSGNRTVLSGGLGPSAVGTGPDFVFPEGIAVDANGQILVADQDLAAVVHVDPANGNRTIVSDAATGTGPALSGVQDVVVEPSGTIVALCGSTLIRIDPSSGNRFVVSSSTVGTGPTFSVPRALAVASSGWLYVSGSSGRIYAVNPSNGDRLVASGGSFPTVGSGPEISAPAGLVARADGLLVVLDHLYHRGYFVDPASGDRTMLRGFCRGTGPEFGHPEGLIARDDGTLIVADAFPGSAVLRVDLATGDRSIVPGGTGNNDFSGLEGIDEEADGSLVVTSTWKVHRVSPPAGMNSVISHPPSIGLGPGFTMLRDIAVCPDGTLMVTHNPGVMSVHPQSGDRAVVSDDTHGGGPEFGSSIGDIACEANGNLVLVTGVFPSAVFRVDPADGNRQLVSGGDPFGTHVGSGPELDSPEGIAVAPDGTLVVVGFFHNVFEVNPGSGNRGLLCSEMIGSGPIPNSPVHVAVGMMPVEREALAENWMQYR